MRVQSVDQRRILYLLEYLHTYINGSGESERVALTFAESLTPPALSRLCSWPLQETIKFVIYIVTSFSGNLQFPDNKFP